MIPIPQRQDSLTRYESVTLGVGFPMDRIIVLAAVKLDRKPQFMAVEVQYIRADWLLPSEFLAMQTPVAQQRPDDLLWFGGFAPKASDEIQAFFIQREFLAGSFAS